MNRALWFLGTALLLGITSSFALGAPPLSGTVVEGTSVLGLNLGFSREQVEASYGPPSFCQSGTHSGDQALCSYNVTGVGTAEVGYRSVNGTEPKGNLHDVAAYVIWGGFPDWVTTRGITTANALSNPEGVVAAYPNATVTRFGDGHIQRVYDAALGIEVTWVPLQYTGELTVEMKIFTQVTKRHGH
jgi:hypothetical protein